MNSPFFSLKDFNFEHCNNYSIIFEYPFMKNENLEIRKTKLIMKNEIFPSRKSIKFTEKQIPKNNVLDMKFNYSLEELPYLKQSLLSKNRINLENYMVSIPNVQEDQYTLAMEFYLDQNGLFSLDKAVLIVTYFEDKVLPVTSTSKDSSKDNASTNPQDAGKDANMDTEKSGEKKEEEKKYEKVKKERKTNCLIKLVSCAYGHDSSTMANWIQREAVQEREDLTLKYCKDRRNEIETFIYTTKEKLNNELQPYADQTETATILKILQDTETWLYNNHEETLNKATIEDIYNKTVTPGQKIYKRKTDWEGLEQALNYLKNGITSNINRYEKQFQLSKEGKSVLKEKDLQEISKLIKNYNDLYNKTVESAKNIPRFVDCPVNHAEISKSEGELEDKINRVFVEAEKRSMEENKKKETAQHAVPDDGSAGPNISDKHKKEKDRMNLD